MANYFIKMGEFEEKEKKLIFKGRDIVQIDQNTGEQRTSSMYGDLLFPGLFREGKVSFNVTFLNINQNTRCGFLLNYKNINGKEIFYQTGIRNDMAAYSLEYFNGMRWDFKVMGGSAFSLKPNNKYNIQVELKGNVLTLVVDGVILFTYTNFINNYAGFGVFVTNSYDVVIEDIKKSINEPTVFNIMKFEKDFDDLYKDVIVVECEKHGYKAIRADECYTSNAIIEDITKEISNAAIIIADITMDNPNVFYELGFAHALKKPTILLADINKRSDLPFDISGYRTIFYHNSIAGKKDIENKLSKFIENITSALEG